MKIISKAYFNRGHKNETAIIIPYTEQNLYKILDEYHPEIYDAMTDKPTADKVNANRIEISNHKHQLDHESQRIIIDCNDEKIVVGQDMGGLLRKVRRALNNYSPNINIV